MKVGETIILKQTVEIHASSSGYWQFRLPPVEGESVGTFLAGNSDFERAKKAARRQLRELKVPISVHFLTYNPNPQPNQRTTYPAIARGIHLRTQEVLVWIDDDHGGANTTYSRYGNRVLKPDTPKDQIEIYTKKLNQIAVATKKLREWWDQNTFDLNRAVADAIKQHVDTLDPTEIDED